ncbi:MAG: hypothetical protein Q7J24_01090 [Desulfomicrobium sp.]|nr:hypothetical protein [Desulfomicrobium sp.]
MFLLLSQNQGGSIKGADELALLGCRRFGFIGVLINRYRLYFTRNGETVVFLLAGGDKSSQNKDIIRARKLMEE